MGARMGANRITVLNRPQIHENGAASDCEESSYGRGQFAERQKRRGDWAGRIGASCRDGGQREGMTTSPP